MRPTPSLRSITRAACGGGERAVGRKIGHTVAELWPAQGLSAPTWGWLYANSTRPLEGVLALGALREPKAEVELVFRLGSGGVPEAMALGIELVDRPYATWDFTVPAAVAAGAVHAALLLGPWLPYDALAHAPLLTSLRARLRVGDAVSDGGSERVLGSPLRALELLSAVLADRGAPALQPGEVITTGALAPALSVRAGVACEAVIAGLPLAPASWRCE